MSNRLSRPRLRAPSLNGTITALVVGASSLLVLSQLRPDLLVMNTTTAGGDMGAHIWAPHYLVDHLLPHGRIVGWTPDWYAGFPALHFYFPLPVVAVALLDIILPAGVAFKLVTVSGVVALPVCTWAFGRLCNLPFPIPACLAVFTVPYLFMTGYSILGGNIPSALAGEYAFSIGLALAMLFLGVVAKGVRTGKHRALASVLFAAVILSHILPTIFAFFGGALLVTMEMVAASGKTRAAVLAPLRWAIPVATTGGLLSAWWLVPFVARSPYMNDMGWEKIGTGTEAGLKLFNETIVNYSDALILHAQRSVLAFAFVSALVAVFFRRRVGIFLLFMGCMAAAGFVVLPQGRLWNARLLPFWYLVLFLLVGLLVGEIGHGIGQALKRKGATQASKDIGDGLRITAPLVALIVAFAMVVPQLPQPPWWHAGNGLWHDAKSSKPANFIPGWATWNYAGYEGKPGPLAKYFDKDPIEGSYYKPAYPEYKAVMDMLRTAGLEQGCGRVMWEYENDLNRFGTPMALMLSPLYTKGCMGSMEGLYFESSATVPYHFLNQRELSNEPSSPMRDLPYAPGVDVAAGITKLQLLGVKYYLAISPETQQQAAVDGRLSLISSIPAKATDAGVARTWNLYSIADSAIVQPLTTLPNVMTQPKKIPTSRDGHPGKLHSAREGWLENALAWYGDAQKFATPLAASGPSNWPRVKTALDPAHKVLVEPANVTFIASGDDRISFHVDKTGVPVVVKASYFPNWTVKGAKGPYRVTPNQMVVVPTSNEVSLHYSKTPVDNVAAVLTAVGLGGAILMWRNERRRPEESAANQDPLITA